MIRRWDALLGLIVGTFFSSLGSPSEVLGARADLYKVAKFSVEARDKNAVLAKEKALSEGRRKAFNLLLRRLTSHRDYQRLPKLKADFIEDMIDGFSVRKERNSSTRYLATLDFFFQPEAVRQLLTSYTIPFFEARAYSVAFIPLFVEKEAAPPPEERSEAGPEERPEQPPSWQKAWSSIDVLNTPTPLRLALLKSDLTVETMTALQKGNWKAFETVRSEYGPQKLIIAIASLTDKGDLLRVRMIGRDEVGAINIEQIYHIFEDRTGSVKRAAQISLAIIEGRWKESQSGVPQNRDNRTAQSGDPQTVFLTVQFSNLGEWRAIRSKLRRIPDLGNLNVATLSARGAKISFLYPGGIEAFQDALFDQKLSLEYIGGARILRAY